jgi:FkbM family methyltransferase
VIEHLARSALARIVALLPQGICDALLAALVGHGTSYETFSAHARAMNVVGVKIAGAQGVIESTIGDGDITGSYARTGNWAERTNALLVDFFVRSGGGTYVDVGANIGLTTIPVAQNPRVRCFALEPEPRNFANLARNVGANCPHGNVTLLQTAAYAARTTLRFELSPDNFGDHRLRLNDRGGRMGEKARRSIEVDAAPLDELIPTDEVPLAVKVDTQGAEPFVLAGGTRTLSRAGLIVMEFWPYGMARTGGDPEDVIRFFETEFQSLTLMEGDRCVARDLPAAAVAQRLREMVAARSGDANIFVDIVAQA